MEITPLFAVIKVVLYNVFGDSVRGEGIFLIIFIYRQVLRFSINCPSRGSEDEVIYPMFNAVIQEI